MHNSNDSPTGSRHTSTPRSSDDLQASSASPHHHGLHFRFRSGSNASHGDAPAPPPPALPDKNLKKEAVRAARSALLATVRDDWEFSSSERGVADSTPREPVSYARREEGPSDLENDEKNNRSSAKEHNPYRFENPDAIATTIIERKRKRRSALEQEMLWNGGLRTWWLRRDAWTKAVPQRPSRPNLPSHHTPNSNNGPLEDRFSSNSAERSTNWPLASASTASSDPSFPSASSIESVDLDQDPDSVLDGPWLPIFSPIIPTDNVVRASIKPSAYATIYSKVVIQSLTPSVPIPLTHMTKVLVEGWKADGAWPPTSNVTAATGVIREGKRKTSALLNVMRMRRTNGHSHHAPDRAVDSAGTNDKSNSKAKHSLSAVKKVLGVTAGSGDEFGLDFEAIAEEEKEDLEANVQLNKGLLEGN